MIVSKRANLCNFSISYFLTSFLSSYLQRIRKRKAITLSINVFVVFIVCIADGWKFCLLFVERKTRKLNALDDLNRNFPHETCGFPRRVFKLKILFFMDNCYVMTFLLGFIFGKQPKSHDARRKYSVYYGKIIDSQEN